MIRAFMIAFEFEGKTYLAFTSVTKETDEAPSYSIRIYDDALCRIFPEGCLKYSETEAGLPAKMNHPLASRLFNCINESVHAHLDVARI